MIKEEEKEIWRPMCYKKIGKTDIVVSSKYMISSFGRVKLLHSGLIQQYSYGERFYFHTNDDRTTSAIIEVLMYNTFLNSSKIFELNIGILNKSAPVSVHNITLKRGARRRKQYTTAGEDIVIIQYSKDNQIEKIWANLDEIMTYYSISSSRRNLHDQIRNNAYFLNSYWKYSSRSAILMEFGEVLNF